MPSPASRMPALYAPHVRATVQLPCSALIPPYVISDMELAQDLGDKDAVVVVRGNTG